METYSITEREARERLIIQNDVAILANKLNVENDAAFYDIWIEHTPVFKIVVAFANGQDRRSFREGLAPSLKRYVQTRVVKRNRAEAVANIRIISERLRSAGLRFRVGRDPVKDGYSVKLPTDADVILAKQAIPIAEQQDIIFEVGAIPQIQFAPTGVQSADQLYGAGGMWAPNDSLPVCTSGYVVTHGASNNLFGILTAGHCRNGLFMRPHNRPDGWIWLNGPISLNGPVEMQGHVYDYQVFELSPVASGPYIAFVNKLRIPEYPDSGWLKVTGSVPSGSQRVGMVMCGSGYFGGLHCGEIVNLDSSVTGEGNVVYDGYVLVKKTRQSNLSLAGDSGGPWFMYNAGGLNISAVGITTAGNGLAGVDAEALYMPIDLINHHNGTIRLLTAAP